MAVYRESAPRWRKRLPLIIAAIVILVVGIVGAILVSRPSNVLVDPKATRGVALDTLAQSVDLFGIEYAKVAAGTPPSQTGAPGAIRRALDTLTANHDALRASKPASFDALKTDLDALNTALSSLPAPNLDDRIADAVAQIAALR